MWAGDPLLGLRPRWSDKGDRRSTSAIADQWIIEPSRKGFGYIVIGEIGRVNNEPSPTRIRSIEITSFDSALRERYFANGRAKCNVPGLDISD
jgi:hypothetical protein